MDRIEELAHLIKLIQFESIEFQNVGWLIQLDKLKSFNHLFEHRPLINNSCYQLLPNQFENNNDLIRFKKQSNFRNEIEFKLKDNLNLKQMLRNQAEINRQEVRLDNLKKRRSIYLEYSHFPSLQAMRKKKRHQLDRLRVENRIADTNQTRNEMCRMCSKDDNHTKDNDKKSESKLKRRQKRNKIINEKKFKTSNDKSVKKRSELDSVAVSVKERSTIYESHSKEPYFIHEFACNALSEYAICSYEVDERTMNQLENDNKISNEIVNDALHKNRDGYQRSMFKSIKNRDLNGKDSNEDSISSNYFDLISKLQLVFIAINLLLFIYLCIRFNQSTNNLQASVSSTHVHFDNIDSTLKFSQFDF